MSTNTYTGDEITPRYRVLAYGAAIDTPLEQLAEELEVSVKAVADMLRSPFMAQEISRIRETIRQEAESMADGSAAEKYLKSHDMEIARSLVEIMKGDSDARVRLSAMKEIMSVTGLQKPTQVEHLHTVALPEQQAALLAEAMAITNRRMLPQEIVVDVESHPVEAE